MTNSCRAPSAHSDLCHHLCFINHLGGRWFHFLLLPSFRFPNSLVNMIPVTKNLARHHQLSVLAPTRQEIATGSLHILQCEEGLSSLPDPHRGKGSPRGIHKPLSRGHSQGDGIVQAIGRHLQAPSGIPTLLLAVVSKMKSHHHCIQAARLDPCSDLESQQAILHGHTGR